MKRLRKIYLDRPFLNCCTICNKKKGLIRKIEGYSAIEGNILRT